LLSKNLRDPTRQRESPRDFMCTWGSRTAVPSPGMRAPRCAFYQDLQPRLAGAHRRRHRGRHSHRHGPADFCWISSHTFCRQMVSIPPDGRKSAPSSQPDELA